MSPAPRVTSTSPGRRWVSRSSTIAPAVWTAKTSAPPARTLPGQVGRRDLPGRGAAPGPGRSRPPSPCRHFADWRPVRPAGGRSARPGAAGTRTTPAGAGTSGGSSAGRRPPRSGGGRSRRPASRRRQCRALPAGGAARRTAQPVGDLLAVRARIHAASAAAARALSTLCSPGTCNDTSQKCLPRA